jgi:3-keto-disaccharide hydrolase
MMPKPLNTSVTFSLLVVALAAILGAAQEKKLGYDDTPMQPNGRWHIHDGTRPQPRVIAPGPTYGTPPSDAIALFGPAGDVSAWTMDDGSPVTWAVRDGALESGKGYIRTKQDFTNFQLHIEWATPSRVEGDGQGRGNSGVYLLGKFEVQVLDSYRNPTYPDGQAAAMYGQYPPLVNASRKPGEWQTYDIAFTAPTFNGSTLAHPAVVTVFHNGVVVHHATEYWGPTEHRKIEPYTPDTVHGPIRLQDHQNPVRFRNIWIRPLKGYDAS